MNHIEELIEEVSLLDLVREDSRAADHFSDLVKLARKQGSRITDKEVDVAMAQSKLANAALALKCLEFSEPVDAALKVFHEMSEPAYVPCDVCGGRDINTDPTGLIDTCHDCGAERA